MDGAVLPPVFQEGWDKTTNQAPAVFSAVAFPSSCPGISLGFAGMEAQGILCRSSPEVFNAGRIQRFSVCVSPSVSKHFWL